MEGKRVHYVFLWKRKKEEKKKGKPEKKGKAQIQSAFLIQQPEGKRKKKRAGGVWGRVTVDACPFLKDLGATFTRKVEGGGREKKKRRRADGHKFLQHSNSRKGKKRKKTGESTNHSLSPID